MDFYYGWSYDGVAHSFGYDPSTWDLMCANGLYENDRYWDTLAWRDDRFNDTYYDSSQKEAAHIVYNKYGPLVPAHSCFGGNVKKLFIMIKDLQFTTRRVFHHADMQEEIASM